MARKTKPRLFCSFCRTASGSAAILGRGPQTQTERVG